MTPQQSRQIRGRGGEDQKNVEREREKREIRPTRERGTECGTLSGVYGVQFGIRELS